MSTSPSDEVHYLPTSYITRRLYDVGKKQMTPAEIGAELLIYPGPGRYPLAENPRFTLTIKETGDWNIEFKQLTTPDQPTPPAPQQ